MGEIETRETAVQPRDWFSRWFDESSVARWPDFVRGRLLESLDSMRVEEFEEDDTLVVKAEMPGLDPDKDVEINISDHMLRIRATRRQESKVEEKGRYRSEFQYGSFARSVPLPVGATDKDVKATYRDGILEVRVPVDRGEAEARKIPVERT